MAIVFGIEATFGHVAAWLAFAPGVGEGAIAGEAGLTLEALLSIPETSDLNPEQF